MVLMSSLFYHYQFSKPIGIIENPNSYYDYIVGEYVQLLYYTFFQHGTICWLLDLTQGKKKYSHESDDTFGSNERARIKGRHRR